MTVHKLSHIAINSTDLDRSIEFYQRLGFKAIEEQTIDNPQLKEAFRVKSKELRFAHMRLGDSEDAAMLDIVQWYNPDTEPAAPIQSQMQRGVTRIAVLTESIDDTYRVLTEAGAKLLTRPTTVTSAEGGWRVCLAEDPDGVVLQVTELLSAGPSFVSLPSSSPADLSPRPPKTDSPEETVER
jgi:catechol 2,3-dioxygenase-like lactoylglutathione lyase family enzyme